MGWLAHVPHRNIDYNNYIAHSPLISLLFLLPKINLYTNTGDTITEYIAKCTKMIKNASKFK